jgi:hypothetical protein
VQVDPNEEAARQVAADARRLAAEARRMAEASREQASLLRRRADSLRQNMRAEMDDENYSERQQEAQLAMRRALQEAERATREAERSLRMQHFIQGHSLPSLEWREQIWPDFEGSILQPARPPRPPHAPGSPRKRIWINAGPETEVEEKDLSTDSVEVRQYTLRRPKSGGQDGPIGIGDRYDRMHETITLNSGTRSKDMARLTLAPDGLSATVWVRLAGGTHEIRLSDANGKVIMEERAEGRGNFEREVKLPKGTAKPLKLRMERREGESRSVVEINKD